MMCDELHSPENDILISISIFTLSMLMNIDNTDELDCTLASHRSEIQC